MLSRRPTLLNSSAMAATAAEARFRIKAPRPRSRSTRVIALDHAGAELLREPARDPRRASRFLAYRGPSPIELKDGKYDLTLHQLVANVSTRLSDEIADADFVFMVATADDGADAAAAIGQACQHDGITTGAIVIGPSSGTTRAVNALRPYARVLLATADREDLLAILTALRA